MLLVHVVIGIKPHNKFSTAHHKKFTHHKKFERKIQDDSCKKIEHCFTMCPNLHPVLKEYTNIAKPTESHEYKVLVVGANKGYDVVGWSRLYSSSPQDSISAHSWRTHLQSANPGIECGVCKQCQAVEYPKLCNNPDIDSLCNWQWSVYALEPLPSNSYLLQDFNSNFFL